MQTTAGDRPEKTEAQLRASGLPPQWAAAVFHMLSLSPEDLRRYCTGPMRAGSRLIEELRNRSCPSK